ncbi:MAG: hypothetical protein KAJ73_03490, partial [Zetaproteobacteria bacterium]|nr:hypothetical protein [Zetaproteobacteria bacterium]
YGYYICDCSFITLRRSLGSSDRFVDVSKMFAAIDFIDRCYLRASLLKLPPALSRFRLNGGVSCL